MGQFDYDGDEDMEEFDADLWDALNDGEEKAPVECQGCNGCDECLMISWRDFV